MNDDIQAAKIFQAAIKLTDSDARRAYLDRECHKNPSLRQAVEKMLESHQRQIGDTVPEQGELVDRASDSFNQHAETMDRTSGTGGSLNADRPPEDDFGVASRGTKIRYLGDYEILETLGRGGMGVVYRARQVSLNRLVALKMIRSGILADDNELRRFRNEADAVALLDHPGIVPIYEVGSFEGQQYFSMKLIEGGNLIEGLEKFQTNPRSSAQRVAKLADAVAYATCGAFFIAT